MSAARRSLGDKKSEKPAINPYHHKFSLQNPLTPLRTIQATNKQNVNVRPEQDIDVAPRQDTDIRLSEGIKIMPYIVYTRVTPAKIWNDANGDPYRYILQSERRHDNIPIVSTAEIEELLSIHADKNISVEAAREWLMDGKEREIVLEASKRRDEDRDARAWRRYYLEKNAWKGIQKMKLDSLFFSEQVLLSENGKANIAKYGDKLDIETIRLCMVDGIARRQTVENWPFQEFERKAFAHGSKDAAQMLYIHAKVVRKRIDVVAKAEMMLSLEWDKKGIKQKDRDIGETFFVDLCKRCGFKLSTLVKPEDYDIFFKPRLAGNPETGKRSAENIPDNLPINDSNNPFPELALATDNNPAHKPSPLSTQAWVDSIQKARRKPSSPDIEETPIQPEGLRSELYEKKCKKDGILFDGTW